jgi:hypothetical protein
MNALAHVKKQPEQHLKANTPRRRKFRVAFQDHFLSGMRSAFFFAFLIGLATDLTNASTRADWDRIIRYAYLVWFIAYFFMATVNNKLADDPPTNPDKRDEPLPANWPRWRRHSV